MKKFNRRKFIRSSLAWGGIALLSNQLIPRFLRAAVPLAKPDILVTAGDDPMNAVKNLMATLGGMEKFVSSGQSVGILVNSPWKHPGYFTHPDVALAVVKQCLEAGAGDIVCFKPVPAGYWEKSAYYEEMKEAIENFTYGSDRKMMTIAEGTALKEAEMFDIFEKVDVYISIPVAKHHNGTLFSGALKGLMGISSSTTNRHMHSPDGEYTYAKQEYLSQCIADLNLIRQPDLCIVDAIECALNNGPRGPGDTVKPDKILAGTDMVAVDAYAANLIGFDLADVPSIGMAAKHGLGNDRLEELVVMEV
jgi:uncharacterized protein (DUF362 family)